MILRRAALILVLLVAVAAALLLYGTYRIWEQGSRDDARPAGAIVVLGAAQYDGRPSPVFKARLDHAIDLYRRGMAPYLVLTGGRNEGDRVTEAAAGRAYALAQGLPSTALLSEETGRTTRESIDNVRGVLAAHEITTAIFVSDPTHLFRVLLLASDDGIVGWGSPTITSPVERDPRLWASAVAHELGALVEYYGEGIIGHPASPSTSPSASPSARPSIGASAASSAASSAGVSAASTAAASGTPPTISSGTPFERVSAKITPFS